MRKTPLVIATLALAVVLAPGALAAGHKKDKLVEVQLLAFNDFHGNLKPPSGFNGAIRTSNTPSGYDSQGRPIYPTVQAGGSEYFATHVKNLEATNPNTFVVGAGDMIGASPLISALFHDEPTIEALNLIGVDLIGVGNHEFDEGKAELQRMQYGDRAHEGGGSNTGSAYAPARPDGCHPDDGCQDGTPFYGSVFQYLAANVIDDSTGNPLLPAYEIKNVGGTKIAFIGETLEGTPLIVTPAGVQGLTFLDEADTVNLLVPRLKRMGVEAMVLLLHEGGFQRGTWLYNDCNGLGGSIIDIVNRLDDEVDVVISGHTHQPYNCSGASAIDGKIVTSASSFGRIITDIDLTLDRTTDEVVGAEVVNRIVTRDVAPDAAQTALIAHYEAIAGPIENRVVGTATADLTTTQNLAGESSLGDIIADAQLAATSPTDFGGSKVAFMNPGGIRAPIAAGDVTYGELFTTQPFSNTLIVKTCTGAQIEALLEQQWTTANRVLQVSDGFSYTWDATKAPGDRVDPATIMLGGVPLDLGAAYRVTMNSFLADGGDNFTVFRQCTNQLGGEVDVDALVRYFDQNSPPGVSPGPQNRITRLG